MKLKYSTLAFAFIGLSLASCSPTLVHTWNIDKYEFVKGNSQSTTSSNIGEITFKKDGSGIKNLTYNIFANKHQDKAPFTWEKHEGYILLKDNDSVADSNLSKAWIIVKDESKKQVWRSTDGNNSVQTLILSRGDN